VRRVPTRVCCGRGRVVGWRAWRCGAETEGLIGVVHAAFSRCRPCDTTHRASWATACTPTTFGPRRLGAAVSWCGELPCNRERVNSQPRRERELRQLDKGRQEPRQRHWTKQWRLPQEIVDGKGAGAARSRGSVQSSLGHIGRSACGCGVRLELELLQSHQVWAVIGLQ
jgi:hypothetical protein